MTQFFNAGEFGLLSAVAGSTVLGAVIIAAISNNTHKLVENAIAELYRISANKFGKPLDLRRDDHFGNLFRAVYATSVKLGSDLVKYRWTNLADLKAVKLTPPSVELFERLGYL